MIKTLVLYFSLCISLFAQSPEIMIDEDFSNSNPIYIDNGQKLLWGASQTNAKVFVQSLKKDSSNLAFKCLQLSDSAIKYFDYTNPLGTKTMSSIDFELPRQYRGNKVLKVEFDALWDTLFLFGETGRIVITLVDSLPIGGAPYNVLGKTNLRNPFGKPIYNVRIRNTVYTLGDVTSFRSGGLMMYGSGTGPDPEFEKYQSTQIPSNQWWLPGFSTQPYDPALRESGTPGLAAAYPLSPTQKNPAKVMASKRIWKHFTWIIFPERLELWYRNSNQDSSKNELFFFMEIPVDSLGLDYALEKINMAHGSSIAKLPRYYKWHSTFNAIRVYVRGRDQVYLANFKVTSTPFLGTESAQSTENESYKVHPNPFKNHIQIRSNNGNIRNEFAIYSATGSIVSKGNFDSETVQFDINPSLANGIYFLKISSAKGIKVYKLLKE